MPACPDWTVRDLFSHMVGLGVDVLAGDEPDDHNAGGPSGRWTTGATTTSPRSSTEWEGLTEPMQAYMREHGTGRSAT